MKFTFVTLKTVLVPLEVEAASLDEAVEKAQEVAEISALVEYPWCGMLDSAYVAGARITGQTFNDLCRKWGN